MYVYKKITETFPIKMTLLVANRNWRKYCFHVCIASTTWNAT